jgi:hypothetical protein
MFQTTTLPKINLKKKKHSQVSVILQSISNQLEVEILEYNLLNNFFFQISEIFR